jgi:hypothetical protein
MTSDGYQLPHEEESHQQAFDRITAEVYGGRKDHQFCEDMGMCWQSKFPCPAGAARRCNNCGVLTRNVDHSCVQYDADKPCPTCGAASVYCLAGAPGTGGVWVCENNHRWDSTVRELTIGEVI